MNVKEKGSGFISEFKQFIARGNVMDMAVGVIVGGAFKAIADSLTADIIMPIIGIFVKENSFSERQHRSGNDHIREFYPGSSEFSDYGFCCVLHGEGDQSVPSQS